MDGEPRPRSSPGGPTPDALGLAAGSFSRRDSGYCSRDTPELHVVNALVVIGVTGAAVGWHQPWFALALLNASFCHLLLRPSMAQVVMSRLAQVWEAPMVSEGAPCQFLPLSRGELDVWGIGGIITLVPCNRPGACFRGWLNERRGKQTGTG
jgi:hypothetical protein